MFDPKGKMENEILSAMFSLSFPQPSEGGLFCTFHDKRQALVHPNPNRPSHLKLKYYEFAGKIVGKCLYGKFYFANSSNDLSTLIVIN